jgi:hypothetical protein
MARAANLDEYRRSKVTIREIADLAGVSIATVSGSSTDAATSRPRLASS